MIVSILRKLPLPAGTRRFGKKCLERWNRKVNSPIDIARANLKFEKKTARIARTAEKRFRALHQRSGLKVHLGCGYDIREGWVNVDLSFSPPSNADIQSKPDTHFINYDLRRGLPLAGGSCDLIYSSHFFEHLEYADGERLMRDCYRVLRPGGVFRIALPDFRKAFQAYISRDEPFFDLIDLPSIFPHIPTATRSLVDNINYACYQFGEHKCIYDEEKVLLQLKHIGYATAEVAALDPSVDVNIPLRKRYTFYVTATK
jgi:predicted SAM-dependent methyltransferase